MQVLGSTSSHTIVTAEDCCTPDATAKIAAKARFFVDIVPTPLCA
jgi:hypothetical protein